MNRNVKIAKELVRLAKSLVADSYYEPISMADAVGNLKQYQREVKELKQKFGGVAMAMNAETRGAEGTDWSQNKAVKMYYKVSRPNHVSLDTADSMSRSVDQYNKETYGKWKLFRVYNGENSAGESGKDWKLYRVNGNGGRELVTSFDLYNNATDDDRMNAMDDEIAKTGFIVPDDCDYYVENDGSKDKYVLRHDDGTVEFEMRFEPPQARKGAGSGKKAIVTRLDFDVNATDDEKMKAMEHEIALTGFVPPVDCDFYVENDHGEDKYVLRHDDGRVEFEMCYDPSYTKKDERGNSEDIEQDLESSGVDISSTVDKNALGMLNFSFTLECKPVGKYMDNNGNTLDNLSKVYKFTISGQYDCKKCVADGLVSVVDAADRFFMGFSSVESFSVNYRDEAHPTLFEVVKAKFDTIIRTMDQNKVRIASERGFMRMARRIAWLLDEI